MATGKSRRVARGAPTGKVWLKAHATYAMGHHVAWHWQWACRTSAGLHTTTNTSRRAPACLLQENRIQDRDHGFPVHSQELFRQKSLALKSKSIKWRVALDLDDLPCRLECQQIEQGWAELHPEGWSCADSAPTMPPVPRSPSSQEPATEGEG